MRRADDTMVAISTPAGRGGIGIVRLSGARSKEIAEGIVRLKRPLEAGRARFGWVMDEAVRQPAETGNRVEPKTRNGEMRGSLHCAALDHPGEQEHSPGTRDSGREDASAGGAGRDDSFPYQLLPYQVLDEAVVTYFRGPRSYTGEDVVEIAVHGAPVLLDALLYRCVAAGARLAGPGEFTERAFLAGRIDLTQAEAVDDLIRATTLEQARTAARQLGGGLSRQVRPVKQRLIALIAEMEAGIDFAEDDLQVMEAGAVVTALRQIALPLAEMAASFAYGRVLREGFKLAIVGRPNAGKSSLFNRLVRRERAIVTAQPGTTRDLVAERLEFAGIPVEVVDTAGLRAATPSGASLDEAEAMGVAKSREAMAEADVVLLVVAADGLGRNRELHEEDLAVMRRFGGSSRFGDKSAAGLVVAVNKVDLGLGATGSAASSFEGLVVVETSAVKGTGIEELRTAVLGQLQAIAPGAESSPVTNLRQRGAIEAALEAVRSGALGAEGGMPHEMTLIDLYEALGELDELTGTTYTDEILGLIFSRFCIGK